MDNPNAEESEMESLSVEALERFKCAFPEFVREGQVDLAGLRKLLGARALEEPSPYGLMWPGKESLDALLRTPTSDMLLADLSRSTAWSETKNLFIEGDNLDVLRVLESSYTGRVKMIYIDPPYNTGKEFIYPDRFHMGREAYRKLGGYGPRESDGEDADLSEADANGRFHAQWLSMMHPRLKLAQKLLRDDGLIFVSIDDNEAHNLRLVMDEVFGASNFMAAIAWEKRYTRSNNAKAFYSLKDTILAYRKSEALVHLREGRTAKANQAYANPDNDPRGPWTSSSYVNPATKERRPNLVYPISAPDGRIVRHPTHAWKNSESAYKKHVEEERLWWGLAGDAKYPRKKLFLSEASGMVPIDLWDHQSSGTTDEGGRELKALFEGEAVFDNPKPTRLIRRMLRLGTEVQGGDIVLDFFAGSGSTADAVMRQNEEDGGDRRFILVQVAEPVSDERFQSIADIAAMRLARVREFVPSVDSGVRYFRLQKSAQPAPLSQAQEGEAPQRAEQVPEATQAPPSLLDQALVLALKRGLGLDVSIEEVSIGEQGAWYLLAEGALLVCLSPSLSVADVEALSAWLAQRCARVACFACPEAALGDSALCQKLSRVLSEGAVEELFPF